MELGLTPRENYQEIANSIRAKLKSSEELLPEDMPEAIDSIVTSEYTLSPLLVSSNGSYVPPSNKAGFSQVDVNIPNVFTEFDNEKVVQSGSLVAQTTKTITTNGTHNTVLNNFVTVNVPNTYSSSDSGKVITNDGLVAQTTKNVTANGSYDTTLNNTTIVNVPNTYSSSDDGKVVVDGSLVAQTNLNVDANGTYNTVSKKQVVVNVPSEHLTFRESSSGNIIIEQAGSTITTFSENGSGNIVIQEDI